MRKIGVIVFSLLVLLIAGCATSSSDKKPSAEDSAEAAEKPDPITAIKKGDSASLAAMLEDGLDPNTSDKDGATFLHHAAWLGSADIVKLLIEHGADVNASRNDGYTPLHWAAYKGGAGAGAEIAGMLLEEGADIEAKAETGATPLHLAAWKGHADAAKLFLLHGASMTAERIEGNTPKDIAGGEVRNLLAMAEKYGSNRGIVAFDYGEKVVPLYDEFGKSVIEVINEQGEDAFKEGKPDLPPFGEASVEIEGPFDYSERPYFTIRTENTGKGELFRLSAEVELIPQVQGAVKKVYLGYVPPGGKVSKKMELPRLTPDFIGKEIEVSVSFNELNQYQPPALQAKLTIRNVDKGFVYENFFSLPPEELTALVKRGHISVKDLEEIVTVHIDNMDTDVFLHLAEEKVISGELAATLIIHKQGVAAEKLAGLVSKDVIKKSDAARYVLLYGSSFDQSDIKMLAESGTIGRNEIDKLIGLDRAPYTIKDIIHYCSKKQISQDVVEHVIVLEKVTYTPADILALAEHHYISKNVVEALYAEGLGFSPSQVKRLIGLNVFTFPEVLYTYTVNDGDSETSVGNRDGMIQVREGPDFVYVIKNNSVFELNNVSVDIESDTPNIDVFTETIRLPTMSPGETVDVTSTLAVKPAFSGNAFSVSLNVSDPFFGELLSVEEEVPVGREVGNKVLALNKKVVSNSTVKVLSGASESMPEIAVLSEGAVFDAVGELGGFYKVKVYGSYGWVKKTMVTDFREGSSGTFNAGDAWEKEIRESALAALEDLKRETEAKLQESGTDAEKFAERAFMNAKPELIIITPKNNDEVFNRVTLELSAIDRNSGIESIDIRVNGAQLPGSTVRGLKVVDGDRGKIRKSYDLLLKKGENRVEVTVYNGKNISSDTRVLRLTSLGVKDPPRLYVLAVGVSEYKDKSLNLDYAAKDAETIARLFESQKQGGLYEDVRTRLLVNGRATRENIKNGINYFLSDARAHDLAMLFFAGHGMTDDRGRYYFLGHDADTKNLSAKGIKESDFGDDLVASIQAKKVVVMLDSCHSGGVTGRRGSENITEVVEKLADATGFTFISAARENEYAYEDPAWKSGAFTKAVEEGLEQKRADLNGNGYVGINELSQYIYDRVIELTGSKQHPVTSGRVEAYDFYAAE